MSQSALDKWLPAAMAVGHVKTTFAAPMRVVLGEAVDLARFVFRNQPQIAREAASAFERRRRNARKANTNGKPADIAVDASPTLQAT